MYNAHYFFDALETVLSWDLPEDLLPIAVGDQMKLLAGFDAEDVWVGQYD